MPRVSRRSVLLVLPLVASVAPSVSGQDDPGAANRQRLEAMQAALDQAYLLPPSRLGDLGYRIDWQTAVTLSPNATLRGAFPRGDGLYLHDSSNLLTRMNLAKGASVWQSPVGSSTGEMLDVILASPGGEPSVLAVTRTEVDVFDESSGTMRSRQRLEPTAFTAPAPVGNYFIYGTRGGKVLWHQFMIGHPWRGNSLPGAVAAQPVIADGMAFAVGSTGRILALDAATTRLRWEKQLIAPISARPAYADGLLLVAGGDQYLWAYDARNGRTVWSYFTESPLTTSPTAIGGSVYQYVPGEGLVCLSLRPTDRIDGEVRWRCADGKGEVLGTHRGKLLLWDGAERTMRIVDSATGQVAASIPLPRVSAIVPNGFDSPGLVLLSEDGFVLHLLPQG